jgi:hypothetical protein
MDDPDTRLVKLLLGSAAERISSGDLEWLVHEAAVIRARMNEIRQVRTEDLDFAAFAMWSASERLT